MMTPAPDELLLIGRIVAPFGVHGQMKLHAVTDRPDHLQHHIRMVYVGKTYTPYHLINAIQHKPGLLILTLSDVTSREAAEELRNTEVSIRESDAAPLDPGEYYLHELYGLYVETTGGVVIGQVREIVETGANEVLIVARPGQSDALIPMIHEIVKELDLLGKRLVIQPMEGLL